MVHPANIADREGAALVLEAITVRFPRLTYLWIDASYAGKTVASIGQALGLTVHVVRKPRRWFWCADPTHEWLGCQRVQVRHL